MKTSKPIPFQLPFLIATIALVIVLTWLAAWQYVQRSLIRTAGDALSLGAAEIASKFDRMIFERYDDLRVMAVAFSDRMKDDPAFAQRYLDTVRHAYQMYHWVAMADREGRLVGSTSAESPRGTDVSGTSWFQEVRARASVRPDATLLGGVDAFLTEEGAPDAIAISRALYDSHGAFAGVITSRITLSVLEAIAVETLTRSPHKNSMLTDIEYQIIAEDGVAYIDSDLAHKGRSNFSTLEQRSLELARQGPAGYVEEMNLRRHIPVITGYSLTRGGGQLDAFRWTVLVHIPTGSLVQPVQSFHLKVGAVGAAIVVPIFYLLIWMQARLRKEWRSAQTERLRAMAAEAQYHLLLQTTDQGIFGVDHQGRCTFINRAAVKMLDYAPHELLGHPIHDRVHPGGNAPCGDQCVLVRALSHKDSTRLAEQVFRRKDGSVVEVECSAFPLTKNSPTTDLVFTFMDLTERKQRTKELLKYQMRLQSLAAQLGKADEVVRQRLASELHDNLAQTLALCRSKLVVLSNATTPTLAVGIAPVTQLLEEALTVTRQLMSDLRPSTLGDDGDLAAAVQWVTAKLQRHGLAVRVMDDGKRKLLDADVLRVAYQSLHELLFNVLKHAQVTEATVRLRRIGDYLAIQVKDRGVGFRMESTPVPNQDGGFGLFNLREQLRAIGGRIRALSVPGCGSRVVMVLPLRILSGVTAQVEHPENRTAAAAFTSVEGQPTQIRILLVDDHQIMRQGLRSMLESEPGFEVAAEAMDGEIAIELAASVHPDVILMDINLPKLNGVAATRLIKDRFPDIAVIGLSMHEDPNLEELMYEAGASAYLSKGRAFNIVCDTIRQVRGGTTRRRTTLSAGSASARLEIPND
ncbi:MAG: response regulator [Nitrospira sp.]